MLIDAGPSSGDQASTVLDVSEPPFRLLRPGAVSHDQLQALTDVPIVDPR